MAPPRRRIAFVALWHLAASALGYGSEAVEAEELVRDLSGRAADRPHALLARSPGDGLSFGKVRSLIWNPSYRCFKDHLCSHGTQDALSELLASGLDFANIPLLKVFPFYKPPIGWSVISQQCGKDKTTLFYAAEFWSVVGTPVTGCMVEGDRPFVVQGFKSGNVGIRLVLVAATFPDEHEWDVLQGAIARTLQSASTSSVLFVGSPKTNASSAQVFSDLAIPSSSGILTTQRHRTCCNDASVGGFVHYFHRVAANFGTEMHTSFLFDPLPKWAALPDNNNFSKGVIGDLYIF